MLISSKTNQLEKNMKRNTETLMAIRALTKYYSRIAKQIGDQFGLNPMETNIISFLENNPGLDTASDIIELRGFSKAAVSEGIDALAQKGMLVRNEDEADKRLVHLQLTAASRPVGKALRDSRRRFSDRCFAGFSEAERRQYLELTDRILDNLLERA